MPSILFKSKKRKLHSTNTTGYRGVFKSGDRFRAQIYINNKGIYLGLYDTPKEAAVAYDRAVIKYNLPKDRLNWPDGYPKVYIQKRTKENFYQLILLGIEEYPRGVRSSEHRSVLIKNKHILDYMIHQKKPQLHMIVLSSNTIYQKIN